MNFYLATVLLWLVVIPLTIAGCCGLWSLCAYCWREYQLAKLWDDKTGAGPKTTPTPWAGRISADGRTGPGTYPRDAA